MSKVIVFPESASRPKAVSTPPLSSEQVERVRWALEISKREVRILTEPLRCCEALLGVEG